MRLSLTISLGLIAIFAAIFAMIILSKPKVTKPTINITLPFSKINKECEQQSPDFTAETMCNLSQNTFERFRAVCEAAIHDDYLRTRGIMQMSEYGVCTITRAKDLNGKIGWEINGTAHQMYVGVPEYGAPTNEIGDNLLGAKCANFGQIQFECRLDNTGDCSDLKVISKTNQNGFVCMDGVVY